MRVKTVATAFVSTLALAVGLTACSDKDAARMAADESEVTAMKVEPVNEDIGDLFAGIAPANTGEPAADLLLAAFSGPYDGVPQFDKADISGVKAAMEAAMEKNLAEVDAIVNNPEEPTFANTIIALEKSGEELGRVFAYWGIWSSNMSTPEFREIQAEMAPKLSAFRSKINQNEKLFARVKAVYESDVMDRLRPDQQRLVWLVYDGFASNGATLEGAAKERYAAINERLAELHTKFANNVLHDEESYAVYFNEDQASGLPSDFLAAAKSAAERNPGDGVYAVTNTRSSMDPLLTYADDRELRRKVWEMYYSRGDHGDEYDNNAIIAES